MKVWTRARAGHILLTHAENEVATPRPLTPCSVQGE